MDKNWKLKIVSTSLLLFSVFIYGCKKHDLNKITGIAFDQNLATAIGYGEFGVHDILKSAGSILNVDQNTGDISLVYHKDIDTIFAKDVITLSDVNQSFSIVPPSLAGNAGGSFVGSINNSTSQNFTYTTQNGAELHDLNFQSGNLVITASSTIQHDITLALSFPDLKLAGNVITKTITMHYLNSFPYTGSATINLSDVLADFTANGTATNTLRINVDATITGTGNPIAGNESLDLAINLTNLKFKNITGYFGQQSLASFVDTMLLKVFDSPTSGNLSFTNPKLAFVIDNSFGIPIDVNFNNFSTVNTITSQNTPILISNPTLSVNTPPTIGSSAQTTFVLNNGSTNNTLSNLIDANPKNLIYNISATTNPGGNIAPLNFIESTSKMIIKVDIELPFEGYASGMTIKDTLDFSYTNDVNIIKSAMLRLKVDNGLPLSFKGQVLFVDENYSTVFTLFDTPTELISAAPVDGNGVVSSTASKSNDVTISAANALLLGKVKYFIFSGTVETTKPQNTVVKLRDSYKIGFKLSMQVQLKGK